MSSHLWRTDDAKSSVLTSAVELEDILLESLSSNLLCASGMDAFLAERRTGAKSLRTAIPATHPVRVHCSTMARMTGLPYPSPSYSGDAESVAAPAPVAMTALAKLVAQAKAQASVNPESPRSETDGESEEEDIGKKRRRRGPAPAPMAPVPNDDPEEEFGVPTHLLHAAIQIPNSAVVGASYPTKGTREEFFSQCKRVPRRGEIGQSAEEIQGAEELGYVMSGSRSKASQLYVNRVQRQIQELNAAKLQEQFRQAEDERINHHIVEGLSEFIRKKVEKVQPTTTLKR